MSLGDFPSSGNVAGAITTGAIGSLIAFIVITTFARTRVMMTLLGSRYRLAQALSVAGITKFHLSRDDYGRTLRTYLSSATHSICIVSISLKQTHDEGNLIELFRQRLAASGDFRIKISLLAPNSGAAFSAAVSLNVKPEELSQEITQMLGLLVEFRWTLPEGDRQRFEILVHDMLPMGSAILLDASPGFGTIQIETKLHRTPRGESFGFEIVGPSSFYGRHYRAWTRVLDDSRQPRVDEVATSSGSSSAR